MLTAKRNPITIPPGVNKDDNAYTSFQWSDADKIRFYKSYPQKIGGWDNVGFRNAQTLDGVPRTIWAYIDAVGTENVLIGTHTRLYSYTKGALYNITPLVVATTPIANSLDTNYFSPLSNNALSTVSGSRMITLTLGAIPAALFQMGDKINISGAAVFNGVTPNGTFTVADVNSLAGTITYAATTIANATGSGGGAAIVLTTRVITVNHVAHGFADGDRIKIVGAAAFGGFVVGDINIESIARVLGANSYAYYSTTADSSGNFATSAVSGGGGAGTTVQGQIAGGACKYNQALGYGMGPYGAQNYGTPRASTAGTFTIPRIWSMDKFGSNVVLTPGNQTGLYLWAGDVAVAPVLQTAGSAPTAINYVAVMNNQVTVFGAAGVVNNIQSTSDITNWTASPARLYFNGTVTNAARLISSQYCKGQHLIFTSNSVHKMTFVGAPAIWLIEDVMTSDGLLGPQAASTVQDNVVWAGQSNLYAYNGSVITVIPNNTLNQWFYSRLNSNSAYHSFAHKSVAFNEIWWFAAFDESEEPNNYIIWNWQEGHLTNGKLSRTASEEPTNINRAQYMAFGQCDPELPSVLYNHEIDGNYADSGAPMTGSLTSNYSLIYEGNYMQEILRVVPSVASLPINEEAAGDPNTETLFTMSIKTKEYDSQATARVFGPYPITAFTQKVETRANGRQRQYMFDFSNTFGFRFEKFYEEFKATTPR